MRYTLGTAAKATGKAKSTILRALESGKLSAEKDVDGAYSIDPAELHRVFPLQPHATRSENGASNDTQPPAEHLKTPIETGVLQAEVERLREQLQSFAMERNRERGQLEDQIEDLRRRLDAEGEERRTLTRILTDQREKAAAQPDAPPVEAHQGFWARLFGRPAA